MSLPSPDGGYLIHRTTLDYRLNKIHQLTGHRPISSRAGHVLTSYAASATGVASGS